MCRRLEPGHWHCSICMALAVSSTHHVSSYINAEAKLLLKYGVSTLPGSIGWMQDNQGCLLAIFSGHWSMITSLMFSHEGKNLISCGRAMEVLIWDTHNLKRIDSRSFGSKSRKKKNASKLSLLSVLTPPMHTGTVIKSCSLSPDGFFMLSRHDSKVVILWDLGPYKYTRISELKMQYAKEMKMFLTKMS